MSAFGPSGHRLLHRTCPLSVEKRTCLFALRMSAFDPKRTWSFSAPKWWTRTRKLRSNLRGGFQNLIYRFPDPQTGRLFMSRLIATAFAAVLLQAPFAHAQQKASGEPSEAEKRKMQE